MASSSIGTTHVPASQHLSKRRELLPPSPISLLRTRPSLPSSESLFGSSLCGARSSRLLGRGILARAEEKAKGSSSSSSPVQKKQAQPNSEKRFEDLTSSGSCDPLCSVDEVSSQEFEVSYQSKTDLVKALAIFAAAATGAVAINHSWVAANQDPAMAILFVLGYAGIIFEESLAFNKSGVGLLMAVSLWVVRSIGVGFITFFLSSVLDNLTSTIVMVSLLRKLVPPSEYRRLLGAVVVIAANAGGAWTPIGDVTTTMLWIHGQISTVQTMKDLVLPSAVSLAVPLALMSLTSEVNGKGQESADVLASEQMAPRGRLVFSVGIGALIFVPVFKALTGLPPYMGMLLGLGVLWILTDAIHYGESERQRLKVPQALSRIDTQGVLFFLGILLSVSR
ncbi:hypothetical protein EUGRSUZ_H03221 [Eucalyptus grandis]|uniref:Uncharacterized protein n=2 Tax=Eucalyptus grandis TaxID=71139 RepID=A0ACC3K2T8_EUCGR|nr:hypothetical protein EUGRSUZ_H03221 [Eucalyptus grandis]